MSKLILTGIGIAATLGLAACDYDKQDYNAANADYSAEEANYTDDAANYDTANMDMNAADNAAETMEGNATANDAMDNTANSY